MKFIIFHFFLVNFSLIFIHFQVLQVIRELQVINFLSN